MCTPCPLSPAGAGNRQTWEKGKWSAHKNYSIYHRKHWSLHVEKFSQVSHFLHTLVGVCLKQWITINPVAINLNSWTSPPAPFHSKIARQRQIRRQPGEWRGLPRRPFGWARPAKWESRAQLCSAVSCGERSTFRWRPLSHLFWYDSLLASDCCWTGSIAAVSCRVQRSTIRRIT